MNQSEPQQPDVLLTANEPVSQREKVVEHLRLLDALLKHPAPKDQALLLFQLLFLQLDLHSSLHQVGVHLVLQ